MLLNVGLDALLTKILYIPQVHTPPQAMLSGFWPPFLLYFPHTHYLWAAGSRMEPGRDCYLSRSVANCTPLKCQSIKMSPRKGVFNTKGALIFFLV